MTTPDRRSHARNKLEVSSTPAPARHGAGLSVAGSRAPEQGQPQPEEQPTIILILLDSENGHTAKPPVLSAVSPTNTINYPIFPEWDADIEEYVIRSRVTGREFFGSTSAAALERMRDDDEVWARNQSRE